MPSTVSRSVAARIPMESYFDLKVLADYDGLTMSDYLNKVLHEHLLSNADMIVSIKSVKKEFNFKDSIAQLKRILGKTDDENFKNIK